MTNVIFNCMNDMILRMNDIINEDIDIKQLQRIAVYLSPYDREILGIISLRIAKYCKAINNGEKDKFFKIHSIMAEYSVEHRISMDDMKMIDGLKSLILRIESVIEEIVINKSPSSEWFNEFETMIKNKKFARYETSFIGEMSLAIYYLVDAMMKHGKLRYGEVLKSTMLEVNNVANRTISSQNLKYGVFRDFGNFLFHMTKLGYTRSTMNDKIVYRKTV